MHNNQGKLRPDVLLLADSTKVKRSKLMGCGIKPKDGKEEVLSSLIVELCKNDFFELLKDFDLEELYENESEVDKFLSIKEKLFGEILSVRELFDLDSASTDYIKENAIFIRERFPELITDSFSIKEMELLEIAFRFKIYLKLSEFEFKEFIFKFLEFQIKSDPYKNWFTVKGDMILLRNNVNVRELRDYLSYSYMLLPVKKVEVVNSILEELEEYLTEIFLLDIEMPNEEEVEFAKAVIKNFI